MNRAFGNLKLSQKTMILAGQFRSFPNSARNTPLFDEGFAHSLVWLSIITARNVTYGPIVESGYIGLQELLTLEIPTARYGWFRFTDPRLAEILQVYEYSKCETSGQIW